MKVMIRVGTRAVHVWRFTPTPAPSGADPPPQAGEGFAHVELAFNETSLVFLHRKRERVANDQYCARVIKHKTTCAHPSPNASWGRVVCGANREGAYR